MKITDLIKKVRDYGLYTVFKRYYSFYRAEVLDNEDPEGLGRLKIKCRAIFRDEEPDLWVIPKGVMASNGAGFYMLPQKGDFVYLMFEEGDVRFPVWEYGWWLQGKGVKDIDVNKYSIVTPNGNRIDIDDTGDSITFKTKGNVEFELKNSGSITMKDGLSGEVEISDGLVAIRGAGGNLFTELTKQLTAEETLTVLTIMGPSSTPVNSTLFTQIKATINTFLKE